MLVFTFTSIFYTCQIHILHQAASASNLHTSLSIFHLATSTDNKLGIYPLQSGLLLRTDTRPCAIQSLYEVAPFDDHLPLIAAFRLGVCVGGGSPVDLLRLLTSYLDLFKLCQNRCVLDQSSGLAFWSRFGQGFGVFAVTELDEARCGVRLAIGSVGSFRSDCRPINVQNIVNSLELSIGHKSLEVSTRKALSTASNVRQRPIGFGQLVRESDFLKQRLDDVDTILQGRHIAQQRLVQTAGTKKSRVDQIRP